MEGGLSSYQYPDRFTITGNHHDSIIRYISTSIEKWGLVQREIDRYRCYDARGVLTQIPSNHIVIDREKAIEYRP